MMVGAIIVMGLGKICLQSLFLRRILHLKKRNRVELSTGEKKTGVGMAWLRELGEMDLESKRGEKSSHRRPKKIL